MSIRQISTRHERTHNRARAKYLNCIGQKFGRLTVESVCHSDRETHFSWDFNCKCDCGNSYVVRARSVLQGTVISCGCYHKETRCEYINNKESSVKRSNSLRQKTEISDKRSIKLPKHIYRVNGAKSHNYFANYMLDNKIIYVGSSQDILTLMRDVAKSKVQKGIWTQQQADAYLATWN